MPVYFAVCPVASDIISKPRHFGPFSIDEGCLLIAITLFSVLLTYADEANDRQAKKQIEEKGHHCPLPRRRTGRRLEDRKKGKEGERNRTERTGINKAADMDDNVNQKVSKSALQQQQLAPVAIALLARKSKW